jgi:hypothetical protein
MQPRIVRPVAFTLVLLLVSACTIHPRLRPEQDKINAYDGDPSLRNAVLLAQSQRDQYSSVVQDQILMERVTGVGLVGVAGLATDLAIRSIAPNTVLGLGLGAAGMYTISNYTAGRPLPYIYAAGALAVQCSLDAMAPLVRASAREQELRHNITVLQERVKQLDQLIGTKDGGAGDATNRHARALRDRAVALFPTAEATLRTLRAAGPELRSSLARIENEVTVAVLSNSQDLSTLTQQLGTALPVLGSKIVGVSLPPVPEKKVNSSAGSDAIADAEFERLLFAAEEIVALATASPDVAPLKSCRVDLSQAGISLSVIPPALSLAVGTSGGLLIQGGTLPYRAEWIGAKSDLLTREFDSGSGLVTVKAAATAKRGPWTLLVTDGAKRSIQVQVIVEAQQSEEPAHKPAGGTAAVQPGICSNFDADLKVLQKRLLDHGMKDVTVNGKAAKLTADGCSGPITREAMRQFDAEQNGVPLSEVPTKDADLRVSAITLLDALDKKKAKTGTSAPGTQPAAPAASGASK